MRWTGSDPAAHSDPNLVDIGDCIGGQRGVTGGFDTPRSRISLFVREIDNFGDNMTLTGYDASKHEILSKPVQADQTWKQVHIDEAPGDQPAIKYFSLISDSPTSNNFGMDDFSFDNPAGPAPHAAFTSSPAKELTHGTWLGGGNSTPGKGSRFSVEVPTVMNGGAGQSA